MVGKLKLKFQKESKILKIHVSMIVNGCKEYYISITTTINSTEMFDVFDRFGKIIVITSDGGYT